MNLTAQPPPVDAGAGHSPAATFSEPATLLIVGGNEPDRHGTAGVLRAVGYRVLEAPTGIEALSLAREQAADLVLLDLQVPDIDGSEVCRRLRETASTASVAIVQITATSAAAEHRVRGLESGVDTFVFAPVEPEELLATVRTALRLRQTERRLRKSEARLGMELADSKLLQAISSQLIEEGNVEALYRKIVDAAMSLLRADCGSMQAFDPDREQLRLLAVRGFHPSAETFWEWVPAGSGSTCGQALEQGKRVIVPDVEACSFMSGTEDLRYFRLCGIRAVQSTPLLSRSGRCIGMISTHWRTEHAPSEYELALLDVLARQAADLIERRRAEEAVREAAARDQFRLHLADALRPLAKPLEIQTTATRVLGEHLNASRVLYTEIVGDAESALTVTDYCRGDTPSVAGRHRLEDFSPLVPQALRTGRTLVHRNCATIPGLTPELQAAFDKVDVRAHIAVPLIKGGRVAGFLSVHDSAPRTWTADEIALAEETAERIWAAVEQVRAERALRESEARFRVAIENSPVIPAACDRELRYLWIYNVRPQIHASEMIGKRADELSRAEDVTEIMALKRAVLDSGMGMRREIRIRTSGEDRFYDVSAQPLHDAAGAIVGVTTASTDITERKRAEEHREFLMRELTHRVKNTLAIVQSIASQSLRHADSLEQFRMDFAGRLGALAAAHDLLLREDGGADVELGALLERTLGPILPLARVKLEGPAVTLPSTAAVSLGMAFHALATNASKYGAFASPQGCVRVSWSVTEEGSERQLAFEWCERGGPPAVAPAPAARGFGSRLIEQVARELGASVERNWSTAGLSCRLTLPLGRQSATSATYRRNGLA